LTNVFAVFPASGDGCSSHQIVLCVTRTYERVALNMPDLIAPHGGLTEPVNRTVAAGDIAAFQAEAATLVAVPVSAADVSTVYRFADGTLSPLTGPMNSEAYHRVLDESVIHSQGKPYAWTIPLAFPVSADLAKTLKVGQKVALVNPEGTPIATVVLNDVYAWPKLKYLQKVYRTDRIDHAGADMVLKGDAEKSHLIGGEILALPQPKNSKFGKYVLRPSEVRELLSKKGWDAVVAFQTRNPLHRAHEYALVYGLETLIRQGKNAGAVLNPLIGETKGDDVNAEIRMHTYEALIDQRQLGDGDSDQSLWGPRNEQVPDRVLLLGLDIKMFYGGPSEAVMHAIYRQNMGYTHIVIGRKHADVPYANGEAIWGDFDAHQIFDNLKGDLKIQPVKVGFAAFYDSIGRVDLTERHAGEKPVSISGKDIRATLQKGELVDPRIMRPSTSQILGEAMKVKS
jgi:sulfate adenylyltransferase